MNSKITSALIKPHQEEHYLRPKPFTGFGRFGNPCDSEMERPGSYCQKCNLRCNSGRSQYPSPDVRFPSRPPLIPHHRHPGETTFTGISTIRQTYMDNDADLFGTTAIKTLYTVPVEHAAMMNSPTGLKNRCEVHGSSPYSYHGEISASYPINFQDAATEANLKKSQKETDSEATSLDASILCKKGKNKNKNARKSLSVAKWKKKYQKMIRKTKTDNEKLVVFGPNGPVWYEKIKPISKISTEDLKLCNKNEDIYSCHEGAGDAPCDNIDNKLAEKNPGQNNNRESGRKEKPKKSRSAELKMKQEEGEVTGDVQTDRRSEAVATTEETLADELPKEEITEELPSLRYTKMLHDDTSHSWVELRNRLEEVSSTKQIYRAKNRNAYSRLSSCSSRTFATDNEEPNKTGHPGQDKIKILKEAMPSMMAKSQSDHLKQLKECIGSYVDYLGMKSEMENSVGKLPIRSEAASESSTTQIGSSKLIDMVGTPETLHRLPSEVTLSVTQSVTDALISADEPDRDNKVPKSLKRLRDKQFERVQKEFDVLHAILRIPSSYLVERGFSAVANLMTKKRNRLQITDRGDLLLNLKKIEPNVKKLAQAHQAQPSH